MLLQWVQAGNEPPEDSAILNYCTLFCTYRARVFRYYYSRTRFAVTLRPLAILTTCNILH